jgi:hypothetical protein
MISVPGGQIYSKDELVAMGYTGYAGWSDPQAGYDFRDTGGSGKKPSTQQQSKETPTAEQIADEVIKAYEPERKAEQELAEKLFGEDNPFVFDEYAARQAAEEEYAPEYNEMLNDYLENVGVTRESIEGDQKLLRSLRTTPEGTAGETTRAYERAVEEANKGFAGRGMFFSGTRKRKLGQAEVEREKGLEQTAQDIRGQQERIFGADTEYGGVEGYQGNSLFGQSVQEGINQRRQYAGQEWYTPKIMEYNRRFPTESNTLAGYVPPEFLRY